MSLKFFLEESDSTNSNTSEELKLVTRAYGEGDWLYNEEEEETETEVSDFKNKENNYIKVGDSLPYGIRLFYESSNNVVRIKEFGVKKRILILGVIGSFTPYCWNDHLFLVLKNLRYYEERDIDYICCISTNDPYTQRAWAGFLGCDETILMFSDQTKRFTQKIGMDIVIPWIDNNIRSRRYIIYAEDMVVSKLIVADNDGPDLRWDCDHFLIGEESDLEEYSDSEFSV